MSFASVGQSAWPLLIVVLNLNNTARIQAASSRFQNRRDDRSVLNRRQFPGERFGGCLAFANGIRCVNKRFDTAISITVLPREASVGVWSVLHEQRVRGRVSGGIRGKSIAAMCLIDGHLSLVPHVVEPLLRVDIRPGGDPGRGVDCGGLATTFEVLPIDGQRNRILSTNPAGFGPAGCG